jgi:hypothetical protein
MRRTTLVVTCFLGLTSALVPAYMAYTLWSRGPTPPKKVQLFSMLQFNPLNALAPLADHLPVRVTFGDRTVDNFIVDSTQIQNVGQSPILPSDYSEPLSVTSPSPYTILAVETAPGSVRLSWNRAAEDRFEAVPALLNPGDVVTVSVYLTDTTKNSTLSPAMMTDAEKVRASFTPNIELKWSARIVNLSGFSPAPPIRTLPSADPLGVVVFLEGWRLVWVLVLAATFLGCYLYLLRAGGLTQLNAGWSIVIVGAALLSFAAAEAITDVLDGGTLYMSALNVPNIATLAVHLLLVGYLARVAWAKQSRVSRSVPTELPNVE